MRQLSFIFISLVLLATINACREELYVIPSHNQDTGAQPTQGNIVCMY